MGEIELEVGDRVTINNKSKFLYDGTIGFCANTITKIERIGKNGWYTTFEKIDENIKIGEYCRTDNGLIGKYYINKNSFNVLKINEKEIGIDIEKDIIKHSKDIIDLIEKNDYVNGYLVTDKYLLNGEITVLETTGDYKNAKCLCNGDIETILTKEMFEANCYKIKEK